MRRGLTRRALGTHRDLAGASLANIPTTCSAWSTAYSRCWRPPAFLARLSPTPPGRSSVRVRWNVIETSTLLPSDMTHPKKIGFLSFGAWHPGGGLTRSAAEAHHQTVELAVAAEEIGIDGAFVRVHHFARQLASPFPLLAAIGVKTSRIEIGTGVIDMRYENPLYMAETAAASDLLAGGRLQLGVSRGSPEPAWHGAEAFGYSLDPDEARDKTSLFMSAIAGAGVVRADAGGRPSDALLAVQPQSPGLADRIWWGSGSRETAIWAGENGYNLMSSTLLLEDTQVPFDELQAEQIVLFREAWREAGHDRE